jgi:hypothetical protein
MEACATGIPQSAISFQKFKLCQIHGFLRLSACKAGRFKLNPNGERKRVFSHLKPSLCLEDRQSGRFASMVKLGSKVPHLKAASKHTRWE